MSQLSLETVAKKEEKKIRKPNQENCGLIEIPLEVFEITSLSKLMDKIFTPLKLIFTMLFFILTQTLFAQFPQFEFHKIGEYGIRMGQTALVDLDEDGDLDWIFGEFGKMSWFEYVSADEWIFHSLGEGAKTDVGGCAVDINKDGKTDFMAGTGWYENTGEPKSELFRFHHAFTIPCHDNVAVDINGDGKLDILANSNDKNNPNLVWFETSVKPGASWKHIFIGKGIHGGCDPKGFGDLDGDGDTDIVRGDSWFENNSDSGYSWSEHPLIPKGGSRSGMYGLALKSWVTDLDKDGDLDIVEAECDTPNTRVFWWENKKGGEKWKFHPISKNSTDQDFHSLAVFDFDNDGDEDVFSGGGPMTKGMHQWIIWENIKGNASAWKKHIVLEGFRCHEAKAADIDGDGDIDICSKPWNGNMHVYLENKLIQK